MKRFKGFGLAEVVLATGILATLVGGTAYLVSSAQSITKTSYIRQLAHGFAVDGLTSVGNYLEQVRNNPEYSSWLGGLSSSGDHGLAFNPGVPSGVFEPQADRSIIVYFNKNASDLNKTWRAAASTPLPSEATTGVRAKELVSNGLGDNTSDLSIYDTKWTARVVLNNNLIDKGLVEEREISTNESVAGASIKMWRYIVISKFEPGTKDANNSPLRFEDTIKDENGKCPLFNNGVCGGAIIDHAPLAIKVNSIVTWGNEAPEEQERAETIFTNWQGR